MICGLSSLAAIVAVMLTVTFSLISASLLPDSRPNLVD